MDITVFTSNGWGPCHMVKVYLSRKGVPFVERNVSESLADKQLLLSMGYRFTPVTVIGDTRIIGYKPNAIEDALALLPK